MSQKLEPFEPLHPDKVNMYCCGPTVYGLLHVGNFRGAVFYNFLRNWLEYLGYSVKYVYNFTDVDDKIINRAKTEKCDPAELAKLYITEFWKDFNCLGLKPHSVNPTVTESMSEITNYIKGLVDKQLAYATESGDVYFEVRKFADYGKLSHRKIDDLIEAVRIEKDDRKKDALDFALWKASQDSELSWPSPWGPGRPGWHIECSAMIQKHLGEQIDIHGGGLDLLFPHHENELAQSEGLCNKSFVKYWVHNNMIQFDGAKMSKSLGNIVTGRDFFARYHPEIYKYLVLSVHYRSILELGVDSIASSIKGLAKFYSVLNQASHFLTVDNQVESKVPVAFQQQYQAFREKIIADASKDFNSAIIISHLHEFIKLYNQKVRRGMKVTPEVLGMSQLVLDLFKEFGSLMALFQEPPHKFLYFLDDMLLSEKQLERSAIQTKVQERQIYRADKNFTEADRVRKELDSMGISVSDMPDGSCYWEVTK